MRRCAKYHNCLAFRLEILIKEQNFRTSLSFYFCFLIISNLIILFFLVSSDMAVRTKKDTNLGLSVKYFQQ